MSSSAWFWIIYVIAIIFGGFMLWPFERRSGIWLVVMILLGIVGYAIFGSPIK